MTGERIAGIAAFAVVVGGAAIGFAAIGPPQHVRLLELDRRRVSDLESIASRLTNGDEVRARGSRLPESLLIRDAGSDDPETGKPYGYQRRSATRYRLCATFALPSDPSATERSWRHEGGESAWRHGAGPTCYDLDVTVSDAPLPEPARTRSH